MPKITVGAAALIALIFIGFIGIRQMNAPTVEERVYLSPWEDGTTRPRNSAEGLPTDTIQDAESGDTQLQVASAESAAGMESIDDFFDQPEEADTAQFATETEFELDVDQSFTTDTSASSESMGQSAEDVMDAYLEAYRNFDSDVMSSLMTEEYRHRPRDNFDDELPLELIEKIVELMRERSSQAEVESSKYVGDEFHFRLRAPASDIPDVSDRYPKVSMIGPSYELIKMRKENGVWRVYDTVYDHDRMKSELPEVPHYD